MLNPEAAEGSWVELSAVAVGCVALKLWRIIPSTQGLMSADALPRYRRRRRAGWSLSNAGKCRAQWTTSA